MAWGASLRLSCNAGCVNSRPYGFGCYPGSDPAGWAHCCYSQERRRALPGECFGAAVGEAIPHQSPHAPGNRFMFVVGTNIGPFLFRREAFWRVGGFNTSYSGRGKPGIGVDVEVLAAPRCPLLSLAVPRCPSLSLAAPRCPSLGPSRCDV